MIYPNLKFPTLKNRPYFYTNFVSTIDGKVTVTTPDGSKYWPIGSKLDYQTLIELRAHADVLIHGKNTAMSHKTVDSLGKPEFKQLRKNLGKTKDILYVAMSDHPDKKLKKQLKNQNNVATMIMKRDVLILSEELFENGYKIILVEGGPQTLGSFFKHSLINEIFLTISPKIFGNEKGKTFTMIEGYLFPPEKVKEFTLVSVKKKKNELYLRYKA